MAHKIAFTGLAVFTTICLLISGTAAAAAVKEDFDRGRDDEALEGNAQGMEGKGLTVEGSPWKIPAASPVDIPLALGKTEGGRISFDLQRKHGDFSDARTIFALLDGAETTLFAMEIAWSAPWEDDRPLLYLYGRPFFNKGVGMWSTWILLDRVTRPGQWLHVDLTWNDATRSYELFVDGRRQDVAPKRFAMSTGAVRPDYRVDMNAAMKQQKKPQPYRPGSFDDLLAQAVKVRFGMKTTPENPGVATSVLANAVLDNFEIVPGDAGVAPEIAAVSHDAAGVAGFSGTLVAGDTVTVTVEGTPGVTASYDILPVSSRRGTIPLSWKGWGVYLEDKTFFDDDAVNLRHVKEYRIYAKKRSHPLSAITVETPCVEALEVEEQSYRIENLTPETPYYVAVMALMDDGTFRPVIAPAQHRPMVEDESRPGSYEGTFTVPYGLNYRWVAAVGRLSRSVSPVTLVSRDVFAIDSTLRIDVATTPQELKADEHSTAGVTVTVTDANGDAVPNHEIKFLLATTSEYTGVVGGGAFREQVGGEMTMRRSFGARTDLFGRVRGTYTAGFAAKTAIIVARDMTSNDTGAGYITTYIEATADLVLEPELTAERARALAGYKVTVTSSDDWLTADGESEARITAQVTLQGRPVEGHRIGFTVTSGTGTVRTVSGTTDRSGKARAVYTAGTKIGTIVVQAIDHSIGLSGIVEIELRSDAPAKIAITIIPDLLFADGRSTADIEVTVTDINDNPNEGVAVEYHIALGSGELRRIEELTDRRGESTAEYLAGRVPGRVSIGVTVRSPAPTEEELAAARELGLAVLDHDFY